MGNKPNSKAVIDDTNTEIWNEENVEQKWNENDIEI